MNMDWITKLTWHCYVISVTPLLTHRRRAWYPYFTHASNYLTAKYTGCYYKHVAMYGNKVVKYTVLT